MKQVRFTRRIARFGGSGAAKRSGRKCGIGGSSSSPVETYHSDKKKSPCGLNAALSSHLLEWPLIFLVNHTPFNQRVPGSSPGAQSLPTPATDSSLAEKPFLRPFFACGGLRFPVSALRHRLRALFRAPVSGGKNPVPNSKKAGLRGDRAGDGAFI
jgi:hypothetical protein